MNDIKRFYGLYRGVVKGNKDPENQRRLQVSVPQVTGTETTDWAWPVEPSNIHTAVPSIGQGVWVSYTGGDPEHPIWHGTFGKHQGASKNLLVKPLANTVSLSNISDQIVTVTNPDGTVDVDLMATLIAIATKVHVIATTPDVDTDVDH
jgi:hypothetical protein